MLNNEITVIFGYFTREKIPLGGGIGRYYKIQRRDGNENVA